MNRRPLQTLLALLGLGLMTSSPVRAEHDPGPADQPAAPLALTISGGGTKGAYMAGHLYYMGVVSHLANEPL
ncbi:MAG TPA: hypothetical protein PK095_05520, partial [Myxococcota bacterium]|nr:hypothetical protein [Myxococcota bacterium]